jgi:hypothetical protein
MRFFVDNNLAPAISHALHALSQREEIEVLHLRSKFPPNVTDVEWLETLRQERNRVILSGDFTITKKSHERLAWQQCGLTVFFLQKGWTNIPFWDQSWKIVKWWPTIFTTAKRFETGHSFLVPISGNKLKAIAPR